MTNCNYLAIDAGGTYFKYALIDANGNFLSDIRKTKIDEKGDVSSVLATYEYICNEFKDFSYVSVSTPGPFDYKNGKSLMKHKFKSIYNVSLKTELEKISNADVYFVSDSNAFLLGECNGKYKNAIGITIGTGFGFAVVKDGVICTDENGGPCEKPYSLPYKDLIAEDYISARGITKRYKMVTGISCDAKDVAERAKRGEKEAQKVYEDMGIAISDILKPYIKKYNSKVLIIGGQVAQSFELFGKYINLDIDVIPAQNIIGSALVGTVFYGIEQNKHKR